MIQRYGFNGKCDGESGRCLEDMVKDDDGEFVLFYDYETVVERLQSRRDAVQEHLQLLARAEQAEAEVERLREAEAELHEIASVLPGVAYMDPPDGGSPSIAEQVRRMRADLDRTAAEVERLRAERVITASPWRYQEWGGLVVGGGEGSAEVLICTMATNTRHDEGRHNRELIIEAPTLRARLDKAEAEVERLRADAERYRWLADKVLACDYGDNDKGCVGWHIRHCKGPAWIAGDSIDAAIDAAIARGKE